MITKRLGGGVVPKNIPYAAILPSGVKIDASKEFYRGRSYAFFFHLCESDPTCDATGYLGVEFDIDGQTHYAWIKLTVHAELRFQDSQMTMSVFDFAYGTIPGKLIRAGQVQASDE